MRKVSPMAAKFYGKKSARHPNGRGICRNCSESVYREGLCKKHLWSKRKAERDATIVRYERNCPTCQKVITTSLSTQKYCSQKCNDRGRLERERKLPKPTLTPCDKCGTVYRRYTTWSRFCYKCKGNAPRRGQLGLKLTKGMIDAVCEQCQKPFSHKARSSDRKGRFCSTACWYLCNSSAASPLRREGVFDVPSSKKWGELCSYIRERESHKCAACGGISSGGKRLSVDHIVPRRIATGWGSEPHQIANLVGLCRVCHGKKGMAENAIVRGDFVRFVQGLKLMNYPMERVREAFMAYGISTRLL